MSTYLCKPDELRAKAEALRSCVESLNDITAKLTSTIASLGEDWIGSASATFIESYNNRKLESTKYLTVINEYAKLMDYAATRFEQADKAAGQRIGTV